MEAINKLQSSQRIHFVILRPLGEDILQVCKYENRCCSIDMLSLSFISITWSLNWSTSEPRCCRTHATPIGPSTNILTYPFSSIRISQICLKFGIKLLELSNYCAQVDKVIRCAEFWESKVPHLLIYVVPIPETFFPYFLHSLLWLYHQLYPILCCCFEPN
jgi:hypothetical protein